MTVEPAQPAEKPALFSGPARYVASSPWGAVSATLATFVIFGGQILGILLLGLVLSQGTNWLEEPISPQDFTSLASPVGLSIAIASQLASIVLVWAFAGREGQRRRVLQLASPGPHWTTYLGAGLIVLVVSGIIELIFYKGLGYDIHQDTSWLAEGTRSAWWPFAVLMAVVLAPLWEELTFRGFLLSALAQTRLGFWGGALIANVAWTALHGNYSLPGLVSVFGAGVVLSWLLWRTGTIRVPIAAHAIANLVAVAFAYFFVPV